MTGSAALTWEQVVDEREEERLVLVDELRQVHVAQHAHHDRRLGVIRVLTLVVAERAQYRQDVAQTEVVVHLLGELFLAELVEDEELARQHDVVDEADAGELDADDDLTVRHHHGYRPKVDLQVLRKLLSTRVTRVLQK